MTLIVNINLVTLTIAYPIFSLAWSMISKKCQAKILGFKRSVKKKLQVQAQLRPGSALGLESEPGSGSAWNEI